MKKVKCSILGAVAFITLATSPLAGLNCHAAEGTEIAINETNFPDEVFRAYVIENFDTDSNGTLSAEEIGSVKSIDVSDNTITTLEGIEYFTALSELDCNKNNLTSLDVSQNPALTELSCYDNNLTNLDVSQSPVLTELSCGYNNLTNLDVSQSPALTKLSCGHDNLTNLDVSQNPELTYLECWENNLTSLDVSNNSALENIIHDEDVEIIRGEQSPNEDDKTSPEDDKTSSDTHTHIFGAYTTTKEPTALTEGTQTRTCSVCGQTESIAIPKLTPTLTLNVTKLPLEVKQSTTKVVVSGLADGDYVKAWESSNTKVATVSSTGKITGKKAGKATITVTLASGKQGTVAVTVQKKAVETTKISGLSKKLTLKKGKKAVLKPVITPITSLEKVKYKSSNKKVATVSAKGVIKAKAPGKTKITVISGKKKVTVKVTVTKK